MVTIVYEAIDVSTIALSVILVNILNEPQLIDPSKSRY